MPVPSFMTKSTTDVLDTSGPTRAGTPDSDTGKKAPAKKDARTAESRQARTAIVVSVVWLALVLWMAITMASGHRFDISTFLTVLIIGAVMPLAVVWGAAWIMAAPKKGQTPAGTTSDGEAGSGETSTAEANTARASTPEAGTVKASTAKASTADASIAEAGGSAGRQWNVPKLALVVGWVERHRTQAVFSVGVLAVVVAQVVALASKSNLPADHPGHATGASVGISLLKVLVYALLLGVVTVVLGLAKLKVDKLKVAAWLLLAIGSIDCCFAAVSMYIMPRDPDLIAGGTGADDGSASWGSSNTAGTAAIPEGAARRMEVAWGLMGKTGREIMSKAAQFAPPTVEGIGTSGNNQLYALVNGNVVYEGSTINGYTVRKIYEDKIEFQKDGVVYTQTLY